jgi:purine-binding chemotaxis protein CheW
MNTETTSLAGKYLTVALDREVYGLPVLRIREIIRLQKITPVPQMPAWVKGIINLRGRVIPVIDLRVKFGLPAEFGERTCVVVAEVKLPSQRSIQMGLVVDGVEEVLSVDAAGIEPTPDFGVQVDTACFLGMAKVHGRVQTLLDLDRIVAADALLALPDAA